MTYLPRHSSEIRAELRRACSCRVALMSAMDAFRCIWIIETTVRIKGLGFRCIWIIETTVRTKGLGFRCIWIIETTVRIKD